MSQVIQILGSLLVLVAFAGAQRGLLSPTSQAYVVLNLVGSSVLSVLAAHEQQWGFLLLEACWALVSAAALARSLRGTGAPAAGH
jgi:hypothetical protein